MTNRREDFGRREAAVSRPRDIREIKRHLDGRHQVFVCQGLDVTLRHAIVRFVSTQGTTRAGFTTPAGSITYGFFWRGRHYDLYRIMSPWGDLIAHRFDVVAQARVRPSRGEVEYLDMLLDLWVAPDGTALVEDEDEVAEHVARGLLSAEQQRLIDRARQHLLARHPAIIEAAVQALDGWAARGRPPHLGWP